MRMDRIKSKNYKQGDKKLERTDDLVGGHVKKDKVKIFCTVKKY